jgi:two-component system OmpR family sensor kinase
VTVTGDEDRVRQMVANLVANARVHTPPGTPITVAVGTDDAGGWLSVRDLGPGIDHEEAARVFERFYRSDPSRGRRTGGSGLGLAIVSALAAAQGGSVDLVTAPGRGCAFTVHLPV